VTDGSDENFLIAECSGSVKSRIETASQSWDLQMMTLEDNLTRGGDFVDCVNDD
jgi:hypothetical protein